MQYSLNKDLQHLKCLDFGFVHHDTNGLSHGPISKTQSNKIQTKLVCILEADESTRMRMGKSIPHTHEDHIAGKGENSKQHHNLVHKFIPMPQAMKIPAAKAAVDKEWEKLEKISAWNLTKVKSKKQVIDEARTSGATVHFASLMDICHLKKAELEPKHQKYKGWVVLRGDIVKDNSGSYAVFTEEGSSASQMTAAKIMDIISRLPDCDGQAADAVSAYTQVKMEDAHKSLKIPKSECPDIWIRPPRHKWTMSWSSIEDPDVPFENDLYGHPLARMLWERQFEKILLKHGWEKIPNCECLFAHREKGLFFSVFVDDTKFGWKETKHWPDVECIQWRSRFGRTNIFPRSWQYCWQLHNHVSITNFRGRNWKMPHLENRISFQQFYKASAPCIDDHHFKKEETKSVGELSTTCSQIVLKCLYLARIGRPDILWSANKFARSITKWAKACDKRLNRSIISGGTLCVFGSHTFVPISWMCKKQTSVSHSPTELEIISEMQDWSWMVFPLSAPSLSISVPSGPEDAESHRNLHRHGATIHGSLVFHLFSVRPVRLVLTSLLLVLFVNGLNRPAQFDFSLFRFWRWSTPGCESLWVAVGSSLCIEECFTWPERCRQGLSLSWVGRCSLSWFMGSFFQFLETRLRTMRERGDPLCTQVKFFPPRTITNVSNLEEWSMIWIMLIFFFSNVQPIFTSEAVIKTIVKGRSPTTRHVSRTHRVALDELFDRINLEPKIQIKCIATKNPSRVKKESQRNRNQWWIWSRDATRELLPSCCHLWHQKVQVKTRHESQILSSP